MGDLRHKHPAKWALRRKVERLEPPLEAFKDEAAFLPGGLQQVGVWRLAAQRTVCAGWTCHMRPTPRR